MPQRPDSRQKPLPPLQILWFAFTSSIVLYFLIARAVPEQAADTVSAVTIGLLVVAIGLVAFSVPLKTRMLVKLGPDPAKQRGAHVIALAMCEGAAIFGILTRFLYGSPQYYLFFIVGLIGMLLHYPKRDD